MTAKTEKTRKQLLSSETGMTLLEIMIVLAILGGLIAVLATNVMGQFKKSKVSSTKVQMNQLGNALDMYYADCNNYPDALEDLVKAPSSCNNWGPDPYVKTVPKDGWGNEFVYELDGSNYFLMSLGEDRREGGDGLAADIRSDELGD